LALDLSKGSMEEAFTISSRNGLPFLITDVSFPPEFRLPYHLTYDRFAHVSHLLSIKVTRSGLVPDRVIIQVRVKYSDNQTEAFYVPLSLMG
jgi:hypothetical protein